MSANTVSQTHFVDASRSASRYGFSKRHWLRLVDAGKAPAPMRFGRLVRWSIAALEEWEQGGCKTGPHRQGERRCHMLNRSPKRRSAKNASSENGHVPVRKFPIKDLRE